MDVKINPMGMPRHWGGIHGNRLLLDRKHLTVSLSEIYHYSRFSALDHGEGGPGSS